MNPLHWLATHDPGYAVARRAARTAIIMPSLFALGDEVFGNPAARHLRRLRLVRDAAARRLRRPHARAVAGAGSARRRGCRARLPRHAGLARSPGWQRRRWRSSAFAVLFAGVVSSVLASASTSLLLAFILPVSQASPASTIPDRLLGWGLASGAALVAIAVLWPAPTRSPLRMPAIAACRALAARLRAEVAHLRGDAQSPEEHEQAIAGAAAAVAALHKTFLATPYRPTGLSTPARTIVRLVDELNWLNGVMQSRPLPGAGTVSPATCGVKEAAADALERGADLLEAPAASPEPLRAAVGTLRARSGRWRPRPTTRLPVTAAAGRTARARLVARPELPRAGAQLRGHTGRAEHRSDASRPSGAAGGSACWDASLRASAGPLAAAHERAIAHFEPHSVWLHNSVRGAVGARARRARREHDRRAALVLGRLRHALRAALERAQHGPVRRARDRSEPVVGFVVGAVLARAHRHRHDAALDPAPVRRPVRGHRTCRISFAAGQAAFTLTLLILFNILQPAGWRLGLVRIEDVAHRVRASASPSACCSGRAAPAPRSPGAGRGLRRQRALSRAAPSSSAWRCCDAGPPRPRRRAAAAIRAAAASRRLDDAFRSYLAERGAKPVPLADVTSLVTGVVGAAPRRRRGARPLAARRAPGRGRPGGRARAELLRTSSERSRAGTTAFAASLADARRGARAARADEAADGRLVDAVRHDLRDADGNATATAVRMIWTGDHLDAARRLQAVARRPRARRDRPPLAEPAGRPASVACALPRSLSTEMPKIGSPSDVLR